MTLGRNDLMTLRVKKLWQSANKVPAVLHVRMFTGIFVMTCYMTSMENNNKHVHILKVRRNYFDDLSKL